MNREYYSDAHYNQNLDGQYNNHQYFSNGNKRNAAYELNDNRSRMNDPIIYSQRNIQQHKYRNNSGNNIKSYKKPDHSPPNRKKSKDSVYFIERRKYNSSDQPILPQKTSDTFNNNKYHLNINVLKGVKHIFYKNPVLFTILLLLILFNTFSSIHHVFTGGTTYEFVVLEKHESENNNKNSNSILNTISEHIDTCSDKVSIKKYEFTISNPSNQWEKYPEHGGYIYDFDMESVISYSVCCFSPNKDSMLCNGDSLLETELYTNKNEGKDKEGIYLNIKHKYHFSDSSTCFLLFFIDSDQE